MVGFVHRTPRFGTDAGVVITGKLAARRGAAAGKLDTRLRFVAGHGGEDLPCGLRPDEKFLRAERSEGQSATAESNATPLVRGAGRRSALSATLQPLLSEPIAK